jgi:AAA+ superfamily predicted ATPase
MIDRFTWQASPGSTAKALAARALYGENDPGRLGSVEVTGRTAELPFYLTLALYHLELRLPAVPTLHVFLLANEKSAYLLDGTSRPIHQANEAEGIEVTEEHALDYLRLFCFAVRGDQGAFLLFEEPAAAPPEEDERAAGIAALATPLRLEGRDEEGRFLIRGTVHYADTLFTSLFAVGEKGFTLMVEDDQLAQNVPPEVVPRVPNLHPAAVIIARLESSGALVPTGAAILRTLVELLLEKALRKQAETRLLAHFNARLEGGSPLDRFAHLVMTASPIVALESTLPFVEETVALIAHERTAGTHQARLVRPQVDANDDTRLRVDVPDSGPAVVLLPFHSYRGIVDADRVAHELAAHEVSCLIGCERLADLSESLRQVVDLTLTLPRLDPEVFARLFRRVMGDDPPEGWQDEDTHWVTLVHHSDFQHPQLLRLPSGEALTYLRERAQQRLRDLEPVQGLRLRELHGLGEARAFAEDLIADIHEAIAGRLDWLQVDRGVLLVGAPGTGKTTLARAIAKDCGIRFINASAASWQTAGYLGDHIRAMRADFALARRFAPAILFIDEIDSIGNRETFTGHNAQYMTEVVNALLEQMQGMDPAAPVIVIAATNHRDRVDPALRRAGRLDREIGINRPNADALEQIFKHYLKAYAGDELDPDIDVHALGGLSVGLTGADIELFVRGALRRARRARRPLRQSDLLDEVTYKPRDARSSPRLTPEELRRVAVHEAGHALASYLTSSRGEQLGFVSIVPRANGTLGFVASLPLNRVLLTRAEYLEQLEVILAGRAAEEIVFGEEHVSAGSGGQGRRSDLAVATKAALELVMYHGLGPEHSLLWSDSPSAAQLEQAEEILRESYKAVRTRLWRHVDTLHRLADELVQHQELRGDEIRRRLQAEPE